MATGTVIKGKSKKKLPDSNTDVAGAFKNFLDNLRKNKAPKIGKKKKKGK